MGRRESKGEKKDTPKSTLKLGGGGRTRTNREKRGSNRQDALRAAFPAYPRSRELSMGRNFYYCDLMAARMQS